MFAHLHERAIGAAKKFKAAEAELIEILQKIDARRGFEELGYPSLFSYVHSELKLSEACTQALILVSRASRKVPELHQAIARGEITVSKAKAIASVLTPSNQQAWLEKARKNSTRALEKAVADAHPQTAKPEKLRPQGNGLSRLDLSVDDETLRALKRAQELLAQKQKKPVSLAEALKFLSTEFVRKQDPVAKADRNVARIIHVNDSTKARHAVHRRDRGECQHKLPDGKICGARQWIDLHHRKPRSQGGADTAENLVTLCQAHHRILHAH